MIGNDIRVVETETMKGVGMVQVITAPDTTGEWLRGIHFTGPQKRLIKQFAGASDFRLLGQLFFGPSVTVRIAVRIVRLVEKIPDQHSLVVFVALDHTGHVGLQRVLKLGTVEVVAPG